MFRSFLAFVFAFIFAFPTVSQAQDRHVSLRLIAERGVVGADDEIWVAIEQAIAPHWHTYWINPGDSGTPLRLNWQLPEGFAVGDIQWPAPERIEYGSLVNYGYEGQAILLQKLQTPPRLPDGEIVLKAEYEILVCKEECIPEYGEIELRLNGYGAAEEDNESYIARAYENIPSWGYLSSRYARDGDDFVLRIPSEKLNDLIEPERVELYPVEWGMVENAADARASVDGRWLTIRQAAGDRDLSDISEARFVVQLGGAVLGVGASAADASGAVLAQHSGVGAGFVKALIFAVLGGLVLNLMPCVFPVLSMKALSLVKMSAKERKHAQAHGLSYTFGVILSFVAIAGILIVLKAGGEQIGWGFQLQDPIVVTVLVYLLFVIGLNLSGFFELPSSFANVGGKLTQNQGLSGSFFTGVLATLVAAPCTAPFMAGAIGYALAQSSYVALTVFAALGLGLALPYLVLSYVPALQKAMPKPGAWMDVFKQFLAFPMFATVAWLFWVLSQQVGSMGVLSAGLGLVLVAFALWLIRVMPKTGRMRVLSLLLLVLSVVTAFAFVPRHSVDVTRSSGMQSGFSQDFSIQELETALQSADPVFVEMTAAWCITCKVNHKTSINIEQTRDIIDTRGVRYLIGDWTNQDAEITKYLAKYGRSGVPLYVYYGRPDEKSGKRPEPQILPQILTSGIVADYLDQ